MAVLTETYADPSIAGNSGAGTIGDPYGDVQYAFDTMTRDATNGDRVNILAGTDEVLGAAIDFTTYGIPTSAAPLTIQGYTSVAGDGGIGGISGAATYTIFASDAFDRLNLVNLHLHNCGSAAIVHIDNNCTMLGCEIDNTSGLGLSMDSGTLIMDCYIHNVGANGIGNRASILYCFLENGANDFGIAIGAGTDGITIAYNIISIDGASNGINVGASVMGNSIVNNSIFSSAGTGYGIRIDGRFNTITNNIVEGFSGSGGRGYDINDHTLLYGHNKAYNNATNFDVAAGVQHMLDLGNNDVLSASPFVNPSGKDFRISTALKAAGFPTSFRGAATTTQYLDVGAVQRLERLRKSRTRWHGV